VLLSPLPLLLLLPGSMPGEGSSAGFPLAAAVTFPKNFFIPRNRCTGMTSLASPRLPPLAFSCHRVVLTVAEVAQRSSAHSRGSSRVLAPPEHSRR